MDCSQINSSENKIFKQVKKLKQKKYRDEFGLFIAEGKKVIELNSDFEYIFFREDISIDIEIKDKQKGYILPEKLFKEISTQNNSQGVIGVYKKLEFDISSLKNDILILDGLQDPGNLGTIIRTFEAAGFTDIILSKGSADIYNEKVVRSSMGAIFKIRAWYLTSEEIIKQLDSYNFIATALLSDSKNYSKMDLIEKNAIIFGSEGNGISDMILNKSNQKVIIPIKGESESLNVGVAAGIVIYKYLELKERA